MFDERFARQYRYEPPPEFPLASPYAGIVHHLSGPSGHARTQTFHQRLMVGRCCCLRLASLTFITRVGFSTGTLARTLDSLVRVSRRVGKDHFGRIAQSTLRPRGHRHYPAAPEGARLGRPLQSRHPIRPHNAAQVAPRVAVEFISTASSSTVSGLLTLFPKCFSSFLHSTCSLSVSHIYLALEEVYLPLGAAIQNNPTLRRPARWAAAPRTGLSPSLAARSRALLRHRPLSMASLDYNSPRKARRLPSWALATSLAVTEAILVSFFSSA